MINMLRDSSFECARLIFLLATCTKKKNTHVMHKKKIIILSYAMLWEEMCSSNVFVDSVTVELDSLSQDLIM